MDVDGNTVIAPRFSDGRGFREGRAPVLVGKKWRYINNAGEAAFPGEFGSAGRFFPGRASAIVAPRKCGYIDATGRVVVNGMYHWADWFSESRALVYAAGNAGFIDLDGREVIPLQYKAGVRFSGGLAAVQKDGKCGYIDATGKVVIPIHFELPWMFPFQEGLAAVGDFSSGYGFIDAVGTVVIAARFQFTYGFTEGLAAVRTADTSTPAARSSLKPILIEPTHSPNAWRPLKSKPKQETRISASFNDQANS